MTCTLANLLVAAKLVEGRVHCINSIRTHMENVQHTYIGEDKEPNVVCSKGLNARQCDAMQLGLLYRSLLVSDSLYSDSLININNTIKKIPKMTLDVFETYQSYCPCGLKKPSYSHSCNYTEAHRDCSWVPAFQKAANNCLEMCKGLMFSEFPSRTWGN
jgi:hypothetical protein